MSHRLPSKHLLGIDGLGGKDVSAIFELADKYIEANKKTNKKHDLLKGTTLINLFFENSTRTRTSFELAGKRLGIDTINMSVATSAVSKGETLLDTASTLNAMHPDFIVVRHGESGAVHLLSEKVDCSVINAGDGNNEHPTQALLDAYTMSKRIKSFKKLKVAICGDILHSRVAKSNIKLLNLLGAEVRIIAPPTLMPPHAKTLGAKPYTDMMKGIKNVDVVMMLRLQTERMSGCFIPSEREYFHFYGMTYEKLKVANDNVFVMHPGPINRGLEIGSELADDISKSVILDQVENGVAIRQSILELLGTI